MCAGAVVRNTFGKGADRSSVDERLGDRCKCLCVIAAAILLTVDGNDPASREERSERPDLPQRRLPNSAQIARSGSVEHHCVHQARMMICRQDHRTIERHNTRVTYGELVKEDIRNGQSNPTKAHSWLRYRFNIAPSTLSWSRHRDRRPDELALDETLSQVLALGWWGRYEEGSAI